MTRPSPVSLRKNSRATGPVEPDGSARHSRPTSGRCDPARQARWYRGHRAPSGVPRSSSSQSHGRELREESDHRWPTRSTTRRRRRAGEPGPARGRARACSTTGRPTRPSRPSSSRARPATTATTSTSSTTARRSPTACRTTATCSPGTSRTWCRATRPCAASGSSAASAGTATACPPRWRRRSSSASPPRREILELGVDKFNEACRDSVLRYTQDWERYVTRQARWVDFANDYKTLDLDYMESVMWAFKTLHDKGLVYEGFRVLAYCWRCETPLSNTETRMDDVYRDRQDPALTVWFELTADDRPATRAVARLDHHAVDAAVEPGARGRPGHRVRGAANATASGYVRRARRGWPRTPRSWRAATQVGTVHGPRPGRAPLHAAVRLPRRAGRAERVPGARRRTSSPPRTAPASCTWRRPSVRTTRTSATPPASRPW